MSAMLPPLIAAQSALRACVPTQGAARYGPREIMTHDELVSALGEVGLRSLCLVQRVSVDGADDAVLLAVAVVVQPPEAVASNAADPTPGTRRPGRAANSRGDQDVRCFRTTRARTRDKQGHQRPHGADA